MIERSAFASAACQSALATRALGRVIEVRDSVASTNDLAMVAAGDGAPHGLVVVADHQSAGRGRSGAPWLAPSRTAILASVLLREPLVDGAAGRVTLSAGLATCKLMRSQGIAGAELKWPNDVLVAGRKIAGILCEGRWQGDGTQVLVVGVGLNVLQATAELPPTATSMVLAGVVAPVRERLLALWLGTLEYELDRLAAGHWNEVRLEWQDQSPSHRGCRVRVSDGGHEFEATSAGIDEDGAQRVVREDGECVRVVSGSLIRL